MYSIIKNKELTDIYPNQHVDQVAGKNDDFDVIMKNYQKSISSVLLWFVSHHYASHSHFVLNYFLSSAH